VLDRWNNRKIRTIFANRMLLEGFDTPETASVWIDHDVKSVVMCAQIVGRALRYKPGKNARIYVMSVGTLATVHEAIRLMDCKPR
jgi:superfamily II DNA or RNA helicase